MYSKLTPLAGLIALVLVAGCNRNDVPASAGSGPGFQAGTKLAGAAVEGTAGTGRGARHGPGGNAAASAALDAARVTAWVLTPTQAGSSMTGGAASAAGAGAGHPAALGGGPAASGGTMQGTASGVVAGPPVLGAADRRFMADAAVGGLYEVAAGRLAAEHGSSAAVKDFGGMLIKDHGAANDELKRLAATRAVTLPNRLPRVKRDALDRLLKAPAARFDRQFVQQVGLDDHRRDIATFEDAAKSVRDPEVKAWAEKTLPTLREHYRHAQQLQAPAGGASSPGR
jgi:putative membrane protein